MSLLISIFYAGGVARQIELGKGWCLSIMWPYHAGKIVINVLRDYENHKEAGK